MSNIILKYAVTVEGREYKELNIRRPKVKDQLAADTMEGSDASKEVRMFANLCEVSDKLIAELDIIDYQQLQEAYKSFLS